MAARRRTAGGGGGRGGRDGVWVLAVVGMLLLVLVLVWEAYRQRNAVERPVTAESGDLVSDDRIVYGGHPRARGEGRAEMEVEELKNSRYIVGYSEKRKDPLWVTYRVMHNPEPFNLPRPTSFIADARTTAHVRPADFTGSGYDRGHMAPNAALARCYGVEAQNETFLLSNICPQTPALNEKVWERLEVLERQYADKYEEVWVIDGPIFGDMNHGETPHLASGVAVPTAFYKILIDEEGGAGGKARIFSVIMPQSVKGTELPQEYLTSVREIENQTHLDFFWKLDGATQEQLETRVWGMW